jgi:hypothetical protein
MLDHPLARLADQIDPAGNDTSTDLASLLEVHRSTINTLRSGDYLPGSVMASHRRGGRQRTWTGQALLSALDLTDQPELDHDLYEPSTLWRLGCRCEECTQTHNADSQERRRRDAEERFPAQRHGEVLALVRARTEVADAATQLGLTAGQVYGPARVDLEFRRELDEAAQSLYVDATDTRCGTSAGYRWMRCRATSCRIAHNPLTR